LVAVGAAAFRAAVENFGRARLQKKVQLT
jgi:hypothetical protein